LPGKGYCRHIRFSAPEKPRIAGKTGPPGMVKQRLILFWQ
jgi:hypothetical protein